MRQGTEHLLHHNRRSSGQLKLRPREQVDSVWSEDRDQIVVYYM